MLGCTERRPDIEGIDTGEFVCVALDQRSQLIEELATLCREDVLPAIGKGRLGRRDSEIHVIRLGCRYCGQFFTGCGIDNVQDFAAEGWPEFIVDE